MNNFRELKVWQKSIDMSVAIYKATEAFPKMELYGITSQMRRAAVSVASNIAEGAGRSSDADFSHFLDMAKGSAFELETQLLICRQLEYLNKTQSNNLETSIIEIQKMISGLQKTIKAR